ncbi:hypothetical protein BDR06DRAFT_1011723 [Suillus hirtellus]|nr:hypothetical protein BDR06DRAFT_1011723 [Suillus hirtellus]
MSFDGTTYGHLTDYTVGSYDLQSGYLNVIPSPGAHGLSTSPSIPSEDLMQPSGSTSNFAEELSWPANMKIIAEHASLCQTVLANLPLDNPWTNIIWWFRICIIGGLVAGINSSHNVSWRRSLGVADYDIIGKIIGLQMAKEIWHHIVLRPVTSNPSISIADVYWNQILDQQGDVSLEAIAFIFYEWCQKALNVMLDRTAATNIILVYKRILHLKGPPLDKIQQVARDLGFIRDINIYGVDKDGRYKRQTLGPIIRTPVHIHTFQVQHLQELIPAHFFHPNA